MKIISSQKFIKKKFKSIGFEGEFLECFGDPEWNSRWLIYGDSGQGKTEFTCQITKYMSNKGRVLHISSEQGESKSMQDAFRRNKINDKVVDLGSEFSFLEILFIAKQNKYKTIVIDSINYLNMTAEEYKQLNEVAKNKMIILVSWSDGSKPKTQAGKDIEYMSDVKITVKDFVAFPLSRYGGNNPFVIYEEKAKDLHSFLNR